MWQTLTSTLDDRETIAQENYDRHSSGFTSTKVHDQDSL